MRGTTDQERLRPTVSLKVDALKRAAEHRRWTTAQQLAEGVGISAPNLSRLLDADPHERQTPGEIFIAAVLHTFPEASFEDFFEIVCPHQARRSA